MPPHDMSNAVVLAQHRRAMAEICDLLKSTISSIANKTAVYFDRPVYMNVGDLLIYEGASTLLKQMGIRQSATYSLLDVGYMARDRSRFVLKSPSRAIDRAVDEADVLIFQGGGNFGDLWTDHQYAREAVIKRYQHKPIVILPQTVHFERQENFDRMRRVLGECAQLRFIARDHESLEQMKDVCECAIAPDTAHMLWADTETPRHVQGEGRSLHQARRDTEASGSLSQSGTFDWDEMITKQDTILRHASELTRRVSIFRDPMATRWDDQAKDITIRAMQRFAQASNVVTDRLHGMILSSIVETPCEFVDNSYGKLGRYQRAWLRHTPYVSPK